MNIGIDEKTFFSQLAKFDNNPDANLLKNDIDFYGHTIKNVPVYPDFKNRPTENVSGETLNRLYALIKENNNKKVIEYS